MHTTPMTALRVFCGDSHLLAAMTVAAIRRMGTVHYVELLRATTFGERSDS